MFYSIDRLEENFAVLISDEDGSSAVVPTEFIPEDAEEGTVLSFVDGQYFCDHDETIRRRKELFLLTKELSEK